MATRFKSRTDHYIHLDTVIDLIFAKADEMEIDVYDLAVRSNVCLSTIENLCTRKTLFPRYKTVWSLANAVGLEIAVYAVSKRQRKAG